MVASTRSSLRSDSAATSPSSSIQDVAFDKSQISKPLRRGRGRPSLRSNNGIVVGEVLKPSVFSGVLVPSSDGSIRKTLQTKQTPRSARSSLGSPSVFTRASSEEMETPNTSRTTTPIETVDNGKKRTTRAGSKRKIEVVDLTHSDHSRHAADVSGDSALALRLQEQEYGGPSKKRSKLKNAISISGVSDRSLTSDDESEDEDFEPPSSSGRRGRRGRRGRPPNKATAITTRSTEKPSITPRATGRASNAKVPHYAIDDSADSDALSEPGSTMELSDLSDESDDSDDVTAAARQTTHWQQRVHRNGVSRRAERERLKLESTHPEIKTMWETLQEAPKIHVEQAEQPKAITRRLKTFQLEGLNWMQKQEQTQWKGGLLGDEMGMGKTIQAVSLIMSDYPAKQPTLVVVPPVALMQWSNEIREYTDGKLKVLVYHGTNSKAKNLRKKELEAFDVIMISYSGLESIHRKETKGWTRGDNLVKEDSAIHAINFHRLILDEAHSIKSRTTGVAKACFALKGTYKWCLSGTPVQNRIGEFFSLLRFLEVQPFANYFCKACSCSSLHWTPTPDYKCRECHHRSFDHVSVFNQEILNPIISAHGNDNSRKEALRKLRLLTDRIMLRRLKRDHTSSMELPPKEVVLHNEFFGEIERDFSSSIMTNTARQFDTYVSRGVMLNNYANIFGLIMQMRQVADHPDLLLKKHAEGGQNVLVCNICDEAAEDAIKSKCRHDFCRVCIKDYARTCEASGVEPDCPRCHIPLTIDFDQPEIEQDEESVKKSSIINRIKMENWTSSTKIEMLVYDLYKLRSKKQTLKSIVFSQFTSMLQLIEWRLRRAGFNTVLLDGSMSPAQRQKSIEHFMNNPEVEVFLVSLKAGGVALNLTEASRVFIVDPWWNPAAEWQSADRCHRIGQKRPCVITRLCIEDSVESRIVMLQEKKAHMINGTVNGDEVAMDKLSPEDMSFLFRGS